MCGIQLYRTDFYTIYYYFFVFAVYSPHTRAARSIYLYIDVLACIIHYTHVEFYSFFFFFVRFVSSDILLSRIENSRISLLLLFYSTDFFFFNFIIKYNVTYVRLLNSRESIIISAPTIKKKKTCNKIKLLSNYVKKNKIQSCHFSKEHLRV